MYQLANMFNPRIHQLSYFDDLNKAESCAVALMESRKHQLSSKAWGRGEYCSGIMEYCERNAPGMALVYIRITECDTVTVCRDCGAIAEYRIRAGHYCTNCLPD